MNLKPEELDRGALKSWGWKLFVFSHRRLAEAKRAVPQDGDVWESDERWPDPPLYGPNEVRASHVQVRKELDLFSRDGRCLNVFRGLYDVQRQPDGTVQVITYAFAPATFMLAAWQEIADHGDRFRRCAREGCGRYFIAADPRQRYCRAPCATRDRVARFRAQQRRELARRKRAERARQIERLGDAVPPPRRRRRPT